MVMFHSYVKLPEPNLNSCHVHKVLPHHQLSYITTKMSDGFMVEQIYSSWTYKPNSNIEGHNIARISSGHWMD